LLAPSEITAVLTVVVTGVGSAVVDMWTRRVPNPLTLGTAAFGVLLAASHQTNLSVYQALAGFGLGLLFMLPSYIFGATGAGDVKLFAAYGTLLGPRSIGFAFLYMAIAGGLIATIVAIKRRNLRATVERAATLVGTRGANVDEIEHAAANNRFAYAPAIALGALVAALGW
jgi:prepilin peptidase CpaA